LMIRLLDLIQYTNVTESHGNRQIDRQTPHDGTGRAYTLWLKKRANFGEL